jgi:hypothetical protein
MTHAQQLTKKKTASRREMMYMQYGLEVYPNTSPTAAPV